jgi:hypothetical protein
VNYEVNIVDRDIKPHNACFDDIARALNGALRDIGRHGSGRWILLGANDAKAEGAEHPVDDIFFNAEQIAVAEDPLKLISSANRARVIWDYSKANIARWRQLGFERVVHCPIGYHPSMDAFNILDPVKDIDVLFYGWMNDRRRQILDKIKVAGLRVLTVHGVYGAERDALIARSKVVLNLHFFDKSIFEIFRCSHLFANRACVVTEDGGVDEELEQLARRSATRVDRDQIVEVCQRLVAEIGISVRDIGIIGCEIFKKTSLVDSVRAAIAATEEFK